LNIIYIGSAGILSELPLQHLLQKGIAISAIAMMEDTHQQLLSKPASIADIKLGEDEVLVSSVSLAELAALHHIPLIDLPAQLEQGAALLKAFKPDVILMSCFPRKLPAAIFELPPKGCFNLHPSLLPAYRGPAPVHWQCLQKVTESGVTVHQVNAEFDEGAIAIQKKFTTRSCVNKAGLAYKLAVLGGEALEELIEKIESHTLMLTPQTEEGVSYFGFPD
jgi:methionyl-tRNA formyltransferase